MDVDTIEFDRSIEGNIAIARPVNAGCEHMHVMPSRRKIPAKSMD